MKQQVFVTVAISAAVATAMSWSTIVSAKEEANSGRAGNWRSGTQGAPSVEACQKRVSSNPTDAEAQNDLGWALRQNGDDKGAEDHLRQSIKLNPALAYAHSNLSVVLLDAKHPDEALAEAKKAVELDTKTPIYHVVFGNSLSATGDRKSAIDQYREAIRLRPDYENALYNLGRVLQEDGQTNDAKLALSQALELDPKDDRVLKLLDQILQ